MQTESINTETISIEEIHENFNIRITTAQKLTSKVKPNDLLVDKSYQRDIADKKVNAIMRNYNPKAIGVITLSIRQNGSLYIIDGSHRVEALKKMNLGEFDVNSIVYFDLSVKDEAELFVLLNDNRTKPKRSDLHKAATTSGDKFSVDIDAMLSRNGLVVGNTPADGVVRAIGTLHKVGAKIGIEKLEIAVQILKDAYGIHSSSFQSELLTAVSMILVRCKNVDNMRLSDVLKQLGNPSFIISKVANSSIGKTPLIKNQTLALMIVDTYNSRLRTNRVDRSPLVSIDAKNYLNG